MFNPQQPALSPQQQVLAQQVYLPAFLEKVAEYGWPIEDEDALNAALQAVAALKLQRSASNSGTIKQAAAMVLEQTGMAGFEQQRTQEQAVQTAAVQAMQNPQVRQALAALLAPPPATA